MSRAQTRRPRTQAEASVTGASRGDRSNEDEGIAARSLRKIVLHLVMLVIGLGFGVLLALGMSSLARALTHEPPAPPRLPPERSRTSYRPSVHYAPPRGDRFSEDVRATKRQPRYLTTTFRKVLLTVGGAVAIVAVVIATQGQGCVHVPDVKVPDDPGGGRVDSGRRIEEICRTNRGAAIPTGSAREADAYYASLAEEIGLHDFDKVDNVFLYLGFHVSVKKLQDSPPSELMADPTLQRPSEGNDAILAARFFAPKITDVSRGNTEKAVGWRKIVRLLPTAESNARKYGIDAAFVLFNFFSPIGEVDPLAGADSVNTQVMLLASSVARSPVYWLDYGPTSRGAPLSKALDAFFDAGHTPDGIGKRSYFVPCSCIACHGGIQLDVSVKPPSPAWEPNRALLNYLDTDHWIGRAGKGGDFAELAAPVIYDPGGFDIIRKLNREIHDQNARVHPGSIQERAAAHWNGLHETDGSPVEPIKRALPPVRRSSAPWSADDAADIKALELFDRYCFRCHGTVGFNVFDKSMVLSLRTPILARLQPRGTLTDERATMPPDRDMPEVDRLALHAYVTAH